MKKIKKMSQKLKNGTFSNPIPLGADAINIDMLNGNNLEEEIPLGSPNLISFDVDTETGGMKVIEEYKNDSQNEYYIMTTIFSPNGNEIIKKLSLFKNGETTLKKIKTITFENRENHFASVERSSKLVLTRDVVQISSNSNTMKLNTNYFDIDGRYLKLNETDLMTIREVVE